MEAVPLDNLLHIIATLAPALFISAIFVYVAVQIIKIGLGVVKYAEKAARINALLQSALEKTSGERVTLVKFFGPKRALPYIPYKFMSARYEAAKEGKEPASEYINHIPTALYIKFLRNLVNEYIILDTKFPNYLISEVGYDMIAAQGESKGLFMILKDVRLKPIGFIALYKNEDFTRVDLEAMTRLAASLIPYINGWDDRKAKTGFLHFILAR